MVAFSIPMENIYWPNSEYTLWYIDNYAEEILEVQ